MSERYSLPRAAEDPNPASSGAPWTRSIIPVRGQDSSVGGRAAWQGILPSLIVNGLLPFLVYQALNGHGLPQIETLCLAALIPAIATVFSWIRTRHLDTIGVISLASIGAGVATTLVSGDVHYVLVKDSMVTGLFGLACLASLLAPRPLIFLFGRTFVSRGDPERAARWNGLWERPGFRRRQRIVTATWGVAFLFEATARGAIAYLLPPAVVLAVSPFLALGVTGLLILWTVTYSRRAAPP